MKPVIGNSLWKSPWLWGGLGVVLSAGITVLVLSQTVYAEPDAVRFEGRISP
jgi:hypothetical protein